MHKYTLRADQNHMTQQHKPQANLNSSFDIQSKHITTNYKLNKKQQKTEMNMHILQIE